MPERHTPQIDRTLDVRAAVRAHTRPVRVLHVVNGEHYAGAERVQDLLALRLGDFGFDVGFACLKAGEFARVRKATGAPIHDLRMLGRWDLGPAWELAAVVRAEGYSLLHAHTPRSALIAAIAAMLTGVPMIYHVHSPVSRDSTHRLKNLLNTLVERWSTSRAAALITVSESLGRRVRRRRRIADKVTVVPNGVPARELPSRESPDRDQMTLGVVALFRPRKGIEVLVESLAKLRAEGHPVRLRAIGAFETPDYESRIKRLAAELDVADAIDWVGFTDNVDAELARIDALVLPSLFGEGLPMVVLEAMSAGLPVVATDVEGVSEAVRDGTDGVIAAPGSVESLAGAVRRLLSGELDLEQLGRNAARRHADHFSDESMARGVAEVYRHVLDGSPI